MGKVVELLVVLLARTSKADYEALPTTPSSRTQGTGWIYDTLNLMWFFHLRAEDLPRLQAQWFRDEGDEIVCNLKSPRATVTSTERPTTKQDAVSNWRRMNLRDPRDC